MSRKITFFILLALIFIVGANAIYAAGVDVTVTELDKPNKNFGLVDICQCRGSKDPGCSYSSIGHFDITNNDQQFPIEVAVSANVPFYCSSSSVNGKCNFSLESGGKARITVVFKPSQENIYEGEVSFRISSSKGSATIPRQVKGEGTCYSTRPAYQAGDCPGLPCNPSMCVSYAGPGECNNGPSKTDSGGCGLACGTTDTQPWTKYRMECCPIKTAIGGTCNYTWAWTVTDKICSTADKLAFNGQTPAPDPHLRWGDCACGSVGSQYKVCCAISPSVTNATSVTPTNAVKASVQDPYDPLEGVCGGSTTVVALPKEGETYPASCPRVPVIDIKAEAIAGTSDVKITWSTNGTADWCGDSNFATNDEIQSAGLTSGTLTKPIPASGSFTIGCKDKYHYVSGSSVITQAIYKSASATPGGTAFYYCPASGGVCASAPGTYSSVEDCGKNIGSNSTPVKTCYSTANCDEKCLPSSECSANCERCSDTFPGTYVKWYDDDGKCNSGFYTCRTEIPNDPRCLQYYCSGNQCISATTCPAGQTCYAGDSTCANTCSANTRECDDWPSACNGLSSPSDDISTNLSASPICLPQQPGSRRDTDISWGATASASCTALIGGGTASPSEIVCRNSTNNWNVCESGSGNISGDEGIDNLRQTTTYGIECIREPYTCTYRYPLDFDENADCETWCAACGSNCTSCVCSAHCQERYDDDAHCETWSRCLANPDGSSCTQVGVGGCTYVNCSPCLVYQCKDYNYIGTRTSKQICPNGTEEREIDVRVVEPPKNLSLQAKPVGAGDEKFSFSLARVLLTKSAEFKVSARADSSQFRTEMYCDLNRRLTGTSNVFSKIRTTMSVFGSGALNITNPVPSFTDDAKYGSEYHTSDYQLYCRNRSAYAGEGGTCYDDNQTSGDLKVEPYSAGIEETTSWIERIRDLFLSVTTNKGLASR